jgi:signal transduction histidine kinase
MLRRSIGYLAVAAALLISMFGVVAGVVARPQAGVGLDDRGTVVTSVFPGSPGWRDGIRAGDPVVELQDALAPGGWTLIVAGPEMTVGTAESGEEASLRAQLPFALTGLGMVLLSLLLIVRGSRLGWVAIPIGVALAARPLLLTGVPGHALIAGIGTFLLAGLAVALIDPRGPAGRLAAALGVGLAGLWIVAMLVAPQAFDPLDAARLPAAAGFTVWGGWLGIDRRRLADRLLAPGGPNVFDLVYLPAIVAMLVAAMQFLGLPPLVALAVLVAAVVAYPASRRMTGTAIERLIVGNLRRRAELRAIEDERGRLAREIHDAPLQELAAVIRRLERVPGAAGEASALRGVAAELRDVATALRPPVLEDLGLAAALADLGDTLAAAHRDIELRVEVDDLSPGGERPVPEVEVAAFRVAQEAASNAIRHSGCRTLIVTGSVAPDAIDLTVADDGTGIGRETVAGARRRGHFGLDSMRERAEAVDGRVAIDSGPSGVRVRFTWERSA